MKKVFGSLLRKIEFECAIFNVPRWKEDCFLKCEILGDQIYALFWNAKLLCRRRYTLRCAILLYISEDCPGPQQKLALWVKTLLGFVKVEIWKTFVEMKRSNTYFRKENIVDTLGKSGNGIVFEMTWIVHCEFENFK